MPTFKPRPSLRVEAVQLTMRLVLHTPTGSVSAEVGDWFVTDPTGTHYIIKEADFGKLYQDGI